MSSAVSRTGWEQTPQTDELIETTSDYIIRALKSNSSFRRKFKQLYPKRYQIIDDIVELPIFEDKANTKKQALQILKVYHTIASRYDEVEIEELAGELLFAAGIFLTAQAVSSVLLMLYAANNYVVEGGGSPPPSTIEYDNSTLAMTELVNPELPLATITNEAIQTIQETADTSDNALKTIFAVVLMILLVSVVGFGIFRWFRGNRNRSNPIEYVKELSNKSFKELDQEFKDEVIQQYDSSKEPILKGLYDAIQSGKAFLIQRAWNKIDKNKLSDDDRFKTLIFKAKLAGFKFEEEEIASALLKTQGDTIAAAKLIIKSQSQYLM